MSGQGDRTGFPNNLTQQVGRAEKLLGALISFLMLFISQKLAANLHISVIIPRSIAGANNNEKQDFNRTAGNPIWLSPGSPSPIVNGATETPPVVCSTVNLLSEGKFAQMCNSVLTFFSPFGAGTDMQKRKVGGGT